MEFVIDENVPAELISWLEEDGHQTFSVPKGSFDEKVGLITKEKRRILLTLDRHFSNTLRFPPKDFSGIIRIKIHPSYLADIVSSLKELFKVFPSQKDFRGKLLILEKNGFFKLRE